MDIVGNLLRIFGYGAAELLYRCRCFLSGHVIPLALFLAFRVNIRRQFSHCLAKVSAILKNADYIKNI